MLVADIRWDLLLGHVLADLYKEFIYTDLYEFNTKSPQSTHHS